LRNIARAAGAALFAIALLVFGACAEAAPKAPAPAASGSAAPAALPTATPEPPETAIPRLEAKLKTNPDDRDALVELATYYLQVGRPDKAAQLTQKLLSLGQKTVQVYFIDGAANEQLGKIKEATTSLEQASSLDPTNSQVLLTLTDLYLRTNRAADAERVAKRAVTFNPNDKRALLNYGLVLAQEKKFDEARVQFEAAVKADPKDPTGLILEAKSYVDQQNWAAAGAAFDRALAVDPKNLDAMLGKARLQASQHDVKGAIAIYEQLVGMLGDPAEKAAIVDEEATLYASEKMTADAEATYKRAIASYPGVSATHIALGDYYARQNKTAEAEAEWTLALGEKKDNPTALARLGDLYMSRNEPAKAIEDYKRLTEVTPGDPGSLVRLGQAYALARQFDKARDAFRASFQVSRTPQALAGIGAADYELRNFKEAAQIFDVIGKEVPDFLKTNPQFYIVMGKSYAETNQKAKAKAAYESFLPYISRDTKATAEVKGMIAALDRPAPTSTSTPAPKKK
jgi:tetratricopeptide (TPR) repeat protein